MAYTFDRRMPMPVEARKRSKYFDVDGNRGNFSTMNGWMATRTTPTPVWTGHGQAARHRNRHTQWELYHIAEDYSQYNDLAEKMPGKLKNYKRVMTRRRNTTVFPLENRAFARILTPRPSAIAEANCFHLHGLNENAGINSEMLPAHSGQGLHHSPPPDDSTKAGRRNDSDVGRTLRRLGLY